MFGFGAFSQLAYCEIPATGGTILPQVVTAYNRINA